MDAFLDAFARYNNRFAKPSIETHRQIWQVLNTTRRETLKLERTVLHHYNVQLCLEPTVSDSDTLFKLFNIAVKLPDSNNIASGYLLLKNNPSDHAFLQIRSSPQFDGSALSQAYCGLNIDQFMVDCPLESGWKCLSYRALQEVTQKCWYELATPVRIEPRDPTITIER